MCSGVLWGIQRLVSEHTISWQTVNVLMALWLPGSFVTRQITVISRMAVLWSWFGWLVQKLFGSYLVNCLTG